MVVGLVVFEEERESEKEEEEGEGKSVEMSEQVAIVFGWSDKGCLLC